MQPINNKGVDLLFPSRRGWVAWEMGIFPSISRGVGCPGDCNIPISRGLGCLGDGNILISRGLGCPGDEKQLTKTSTINYK